MNPTEKRIVRAVKALTEAEREFNRRANKAKAAVEGFRNGIDRVQAALDEYVEAMKEAASGHDA